MRENSRKLLSALESSGVKYEPNYKIWQKKGEWKLVDKIRNRIRIMYQARQSSCYLTNFDNSKSWDSHWDLVEKNYLMYSQMDSTEDFKSNLKSGMAYRTINQIDARERKQQIDFLVEARNESDDSKGTAVAHRYIFKDYLRRNPDIRYRFFETSKRSKIFGTSVAFIPYTIQIREVMKPITPDVDKEKLKQGEFPRMEYQKETRVDFEDVDFIPWDLRDFYIDPNAQNLHGTNYAAMDCAGVLYVTPSQVRSMFNGDPEVRNLDKIRTTNAESYSSPFYKPPRDVESGYCELIFYYNKETDSEVIICDDVLLKDGPIPYDDKRLPFVAFHLIRHPGQFYGMGIVDVLLQLSSEDSAMKNARIMNLRYKVNAPILIGATIFGDVDNQLDTIEPGQIIKVSDVNQTKVLATPDIPFDSWRTSEELKDEAVMNSGINPQGLTLPMSSTPATNTIAMKETMSDIVNMYSDNLMQGMNHWGELLESRFCQFYSQPTKKAALELGKKQMRELRLEDIMLYDDGGQIKTRDIKGAKIIPLGKEHFSWREQPRIYISADFIAPISEAFQMRKAQEILPQLAPFAGEPGTEVKPGQPAVINIRKLVGWYLEQMKVQDVDFLIDEDEDRMDEIKQAIEQQELMMDGKDAEGIPGEPKAHKYAHAMELLRINNTVSNDQFIDMMQNPNPQVQAFVMAIIDYKKRLAEHLKTDSLIEQQAAETAVAKAEAFDQLMAQVQQGQMPGQPPMGQSPMGQPPMGQPPMGPQMPGNNGPNVPLVSGGMGLPNPGGTIPVPNEMGQAEIAGQGMF